MASSLSWFAEQRMTRCNSYRSLQRQNEGEGMEEAEERGSEETTMAERSRSFIEDDGRNDTTCGCTRGAGKHIPHAPVPAMAC